MLAARLGKAGQVKHLTHLDITGAPLAASYSAQKKRTRRKDVVRLTEDVWVGAAVHHFVHHEAEDAQLRRATVVELDGALREPAAVRGGTGRSICRV